MKRVIWGFPGVGKSFLGDGRKVIDADSVAFQFRVEDVWKLHGSGNRNATYNDEYPKNYIDYVKNADADVVLINCHLSLLKEFEDVEVVYPVKDLKQEYLDRYRRRGDNESFIKQMDENFDQMINLIEQLPGIKKHPVKEKEIYLSDVLSEGWEKVDSMENKNKIKQGDKVNVVRPLTEDDAQQVIIMDELSGNNVSGMIDCDDYAWGLFKKDELVAYCTLGGADDPEMGFDEYPEWTDESLLLSDVFVKEEHRGKGYALKLVNEVLLAANPEKEAVYLTLLDDRLSYLYEKLGFKLIEDGVMVRDNSDHLNEKIQIAEKEREKKSMVDQEICIEKYVVSRD